MPFTKILVPFDGSELSSKALEKAIELSAGDQTKILILHVILEIPFPIRFSKIESKNNEVIISPLVNQLYEESKADMVPIMEELKNKYSGYNVPITTEIKVGDPAETIIDFAKQTDVDLIVMGSVGLRGLSGFIKKMGSVARKVAEEVECAVLIVR